MRRRVLTPLPCATLGASLILGSAVQAQQTQNYTYDALGRLTDVTLPGGSSTYTYDAAGNRVRVTLVAPPPTPHSFNLGGPATAASGAWASSSIITIDGINAPVSISISGGQYRINGGAWQSTASTISAGQTVQVRVQAPATGGAVQTATLNIGGVTGSFQVTAAVDTTPDAFSLGGPSSGVSGAWVSSNTASITGINAPTPVSVTGGQYRIDSGNFTTTAGTLNPGQTVLVRVQAPSAGGTSQTATLNIGGVTGSFQVTAAVDTTPDAFDLGAPAGATSGAWASSPTVTITGINAPTPISISGGQYRIDGGAWLTTPSTVSVGQTVQVRAQAPAAGGAGQTATLNVGGITSAFQVIAGIDTTPDPFNLGSPATAASSAWASSSTVTITGVNAAAPVSISGGQYRINGGSWQTTAGTITAGQTIQVRVQAPVPGGAVQTATLNVGGVTSSFQVTTTVDATPDAFNLGASVTVGSGAWGSSSSVTIASINVPVSISISGGEYRINGGSWQTNAGTISAGQNVQVRAQAPTAGGASQTATLTIGGVTGSFQVIAAVDTTPDAFNLGASSSAASGTWVNSSTITVTGINAPAPISIVGGQYRINGGAWQTSSATVSVGQTVQIRVQSPAAGGSAQIATLNIGDVTGSLQVTASVDSTPDAFNLGSSVVITSGSWATSSTITVTGVNVPVPVSVSGGQYRINAGAWQSTPATVSAGQTVQVRAQAPSTAGAGQTATLTIGGVHGSFVAIAPKYTTNALNWPDLSAHYVAGTTGDNSDTSPALTISGLSEGTSITLGFTQSAPTAGDAGISARVAKNGTYISPYALYVPSKGSTASPTGLTVDVKNGDTIQIRAEVFDTSVTNWMGQVVNRSAILTIKNLTTNEIIDTLTISGSQSYPMWCGDIMC